MTVASEVNNADVEKWVTQYIGLRDELKKIDEVHDTKRKEYTSLMEHLGGKLQSFLENSGVESARTKGGTIYVSVRHTASLADPDAFMNFVKASGKFELLDRRANATAVKDYVKENNMLPPGCNLSALKSVGVRRPTGGSKSE